MSIALAAKNDSWESMDARPQTEHECGIRMVIYMIRFKQWARMAQDKPHDTVRKMKWLIGEEKRNNGDLAADYRKELYNALKEEQRRIVG